MKKITQRDMVEIYTVFYASCVSALTCIIISHPWLVRNTVGLLVITSFFISFMTLILLWQRVLRMSAAE
jgi:CHASE2 domain-containing sensor protein